jgi:hypothetical protein
MRDVYKTKSGLEIGCMYQKPLRQLNEEEEEIQRVLLGVQGPDYVSITLYIMFLVAFFVTVAMTVRSGR